MIAIIFSFLLLIGPVQHKLSVDNIWMRPADKGMNSAMYFKIVNNSGKPDTLYKVTSGAAELVQIHETFMKNGLMGMREIKYVAIPAHSSVIFKPGGYHVMFIKLKKDLKVKKRASALLLFKSGLKIKVRPVIHIQKGK